MRVISGKARRIPLKTLDGLSTRPTTDRIKETLFNILAPYISQCCFLDLFSGSGSIGIEALSRGAKEAVFVESDTEAIKCIQDNLEKTQLKTQAVIMHGNVLNILPELDRERKFDYIYMDPPYGQSLEKLALEILADLDILKEDGTIIVEAKKGTDFSYLERWNYSLIKTKNYKTNMHIFIYKNGKAQIC